jgi:hypothetical protein
MAEQFHNLPWMRAFGNQQGRAGMAQVMEAG